MTNPHFCKFTKRASLLASTALAGSVFATTLAPTTASAACVQAPGTNSVTCDAAGDPLGVFVTNTFPGAVSVTTNGGTIGPATGVEMYGDFNPGGVDVTYTENAATVVVNGGGIFSDDGIYASTTDAGNITITTHTGSQIYAPFGSGIHADKWGSGDITIVSNGNIIAEGWFSNGDGITAHNFGTGAANVTNNGVIGYNGATDTISPVYRNGIYAETNGTATSTTDTTNGYINVVNNGAIWAYGDGVETRAYLGGNTHIVNTGTINAGLNPDGTVAYSAEGIDAGSYDGGGTTNAGAVYVENSGTGVINASSTGIDAWSYAYNETGNGGPVTVVNNGTINASVDGWNTGYSGSGIYAESYADWNGNGGVVSVENNGTINTGYGDGIEAYSSSWGGAGGPVTVVNNGTINAAHGDGIDAESYAETQYAGGPVNVTNSGTINADNDGIYAYSEGAGGSVYVENSGTINSYGDGVYAESYYSPGGITILNSGTVNSDYHGLHGYSYFGGNVLIGNGGTINADNGIIATAYGANVTAGNGGVINAYWDGIVAEAYDGGNALVINSSTGEIHSVNGDGIDAYTSGGDPATGLGGTTYVVNSGLVMAHATDDHATGIVAGHGGPTSGNTYDNLLGQTGVALDTVVQNTGIVVGGGTLDPATGVYTMSGNGGDGVFAYTDSAGDVAVYNGLPATSTDPAVAGGAIFGDPAIVVRNYGGGNAIAYNNGYLFGGDYAAVDVGTTGAAGGAAFVWNDVGGVIAAPNGDGIQAYNDGGAPSLYVSDTIFGSALATDVHVINNGSIGAAGDPVGENGIWAASWGTGWTIVENTGDIHASAYDPGYWTAGIWAEGNGGGSVGVYNSGYIHSANGDGINASTTGPWWSTAPGGDVWVINSGVISATSEGAAGIWAESYDGHGVGGSNVHVYNEGLINAWEGVHAEASASGNGSVFVSNYAGGEIHSQWDGIHAVIGANDGAGTVAIYNAGLVQSAGASAINVENFGLFSATAIENHGVLLGQGGDYDPALGRNTAVISIDPYGAGFAAPTTIWNSGLIASNDGLPRDLAIATGALSDGAVTINNLGSGLIVGRVDLTNNADTFWNAGRWVTSGNNWFYGGNDAIVNTSTGRITTVGETVFAMGSGANTVNNAGVIQVENDGNEAGQAQFTRSGVGSSLTFTNSGLIDMQNDGGHRIDNVVGIQGNFVASGSSGVVAVDTQLAGIGSLSDRLVVAGNASGGLTSLRVFDTAPGLGAWNPVGTTIVSIGGNNSSAGFVLDPLSSNYFGGVLEKGLYTYALGVGPGLGCEGAVCYTLYSAPSGAAMRLPIAVTAAQQIFQDTYLTWEDRQTELRDQVLRGSVAPAPLYSAGADLPSRKGPIAPPPPPPAGGGFSTWVKALGAWTDRTNNQIAWAGPVALSRDLGYKQDNWGIMGGVNYGSGNLWGGDWNVGLLGGYLQSNVNFHTGPNWRYQGGTVGVSATYMNRGFFVDGLFKADLLNLQAGLPFTGGTAFTNASTSVNTIGGVWNVGYNYVWRQFFVEPSITLTYSSTKIGDLNNLSALGALIRFGNGEDFRGGFGGRVGYSWPSFFAGHLLEASVTGRVWDQFNSNGGRTVDIVSSGVGQTLGDFTLGAVYGEVKGNLQLLSAGPGWGAYLSGGAKFNDYFTTWTARGGLSYRW